MSTFIIRPSLYWIPSLSKYMWNYRTSNCAKKVRLAKNRLLKCKILLERNIIQVEKYIPGPFKDGKKNLRFLGRENSEKWFCKDRMVRRSRCIRNDSGRGSYCSR